MTPTAKCCEWCGAALLDRPHPVVLTVDGEVKLGANLCVRCRDKLLDKVKKVVGIMVGSVAA